MKTRRHLTLEEQTLLAALEGSLAAGAEPEDAVQDAFETLYLLKAELLARGDGVSHGRERRGKARSEEEDR